MNGRRTIQSDPRPIERGWARRPVHSHSSAHGGPRPRRPLCGAASHAEDGPLSATDLKTIRLADGHQLGPAPYIPYMPSEDCGRTSTLSRPLHSLDAFRG